MNQFALVSLRCRPGNLVQRCVRVGLVMLVVLWVAHPGAFGAQQPPPTQEEFVPIDELPPEDRLPAAPFLIAAYSIVWILAFGYFWLVSRRLTDVERELTELSRRVGQDKGNAP